MDVPDATAAGEQALSLFAESDIHFQCMCSWILCVNSQVKVDNDFYTDRISVLIIIYLFQAIFDSYKVLVNTKKGNYSRVSKK